MEYMKVLSEYEISVYAAVVVAVIGAILHLTKQLHEFHDLVFTKRPLERFAPLLEAAPEASPLRGFLLKVREQEVFRLGMRVRASPIKAEMLMRLFTTGHFSIDELRAVSPHLTPSSGEKVKVEIGVFEYIVFGWSAIALAVFALLIATLLLLVANQATVQSLLSTLGLLAFYTPMLLFIGKDGRAVVFAVRARKKLRDAGLLDENSNNEIERDGLFDPAAHPAAKKLT